jgi:mannose/fructose/N-acetylgalactosamine-specific phosphotransferase system component IID
MKAFTITITIALILGIFAVADMTASMVTVNAHLAMQKELKIK